MSSVFNTFSSLKKLISGDPEPLPEDIKRLFNGYEELGGDVIKYEQTARFYKSHPNTLALATAGVVALDKPAPWLYSGRSNKQNKEIVSDLNRIESEIPNTSLKDDVFKYKMTLIKQIVDESKYLQLNGLKVEIDFEDTTSLNVGLAQFLPHYTDSEINSFSAEDLKKMKVVRCFWKPEFRTVNVSKLKRVGLMYLQMHGRQNMTEIGEKYKKNKGGRPMSMSNFGKNEDTIRITKKLIEDFKSDSSKWKEYADVFSEEFTQCGISTGYKQTDTQQKFSDLMEVNLKLPNPGVAKDDN
jgi:hypothetical protein